MNIPPLPLPHEIAQRERITVDAGIAGRGLGSSPPVPELPGPSRTGPSPAPTPAGQDRLTPGVPHVDGGVHVLPQVPAVATRERQTPDVPAVSGTSRHFPAVPSPGEVSRTAATASETPPGPQHDLPGVPTVTNRDRQIPGVPDAGRVGRAETPGVPEPVAPRNVMPSLPDLPGAVNHETPTPPAVPEAPQRTSPPQSDFPRPVPQHPHPGINERPGRIRQDTYWMS